ncbi:MAG: PDDEXK nuclease domain-containing protein [Lachnospiraceae bacterium]|nr:PDDEXK nuclease domain-containing protein [Lachnospiraceae bacterium]
MSDEKTNKLVSNNAEYTDLLQNIGTALNNGRQKAVNQVNRAIVETNWNIGRYIVEYEQAGHEKAEYGSEILKRLSHDLIERYGKGFGMSNVNKMRKLYLTFPILQTLSAKLSWSHYVELLKINDPQERSFYMHECEQNNWGVRELKRQMNSMLFQRLALSKNKEEVMMLAEKGQIIEKPEDVVKDPYIFEFVGLPELPVYKEGDLEKALIDNLSQFLLELGKGFTYVGRQQRINIGGRIFKIDLVFYHRILKCFVLIDLKRGEVQHEDIGQMNLYLNYYREEMNTPGDTEPIGIVMGAYEDKLMVKYATQNISNQLFVSRYQLYLPDKNQLENEIRRFMDADAEREN